MIIEAFRETTDAATVTIPLTIVASTPPASTPGVAATGSAGPAAVA
ncbi:hypothetical protein [Streptosporangium sp. V21-05]